MTNTVGLTLAIAPFVCATCGAPPTCVGRYEDPENPIEPACDECCGHGCEDGHCYSVYVDDGRSFLCTCGEVSSDYPTTEDAIAEARVHLLTHMEEP